MKDAFGHDIDIDDEVVVATFDRRLRKETVKRLEPWREMKGNEDGAFGNVRLQGGGYTTSDRVAVVNPW